jgi:hypothetical protein
MKSFEKGFLRAVNDIPLSSSEKIVLLTRYISETSKMETNYKVSKFFYLLLTNLITIFSVVVASLISLEQMGSISDGGKIAIFWLVWSISISVAVMNKLTYSMNLHRRYILGSAILEKMKSEGWAFLVGIRQYGETQNYSERLAILVERVEKIKSKSIEYMHNESSQDSDLVQKMLAKSATPDSSDSCDSSSSADIIISLPAKKEQDTKPTTL